MNQQEEDGGLKYLTVQDSLSGSSFTDPMLLKKTLKVFLDRLAGFR
jgi:hypothetical protein